MEHGSNQVNLRMTAYTSLFTALIIIGSYLSIPIGPVPIVLSDLFVMLAGLFLGYKWGTASVALFLALGFLGLPVFSGGKAGLAVLFGPTGGFLVGYLLAAALVGLLAGQGKSSIVKNLAVLLVGYVLVYAIGVPWLKAVVHLPWAGALAAGLTPFIPGTIIKTIAALALGRVLLPRFRQSLATAPQSQTGTGGD
jgi:biotin transport system substrate-specific component